MSVAYLFLLSTIAARTAVILIVVLVEVQVFGRRAIGGMNVYDLVTVLAVANGVQNAMTRGSGNLGVGLVSATTLLTIGLLFGSLVLHWPRLEERLIGTPTIVVNNGMLVWSNMRREGVTESEIITAIHEYGLSDLNEVKVAILEADGSLSVVPKDKAR